MMDRSQHAWALVLDASVVIEYLVDLGQTEPVTRVFRRLVDEPEGALWVPDLVYPECLSVLRKLVTLRKLTRATATERVGQLLRLPLLVANHRALSADAVELVDAITAYDAMYAALAARLDAPLVTADAKLARALRARRSRVTLLSEY
jgi:predicted nucleic acid-binding protein